MTRVFDRMCVLSLIEDDPLDWGAAERHAAEADTPARARALKRDLRLLRDAIEATGPYRDHSDYGNKGPFVRFREGNLIMLVLPVPDPVVDADTAALYRAVDRLAKSGVLEATELLRAEPFQGSLPTAPTAPSDEAETSQTAQTAREKAEA